MSLDHAQLTRIAKRLREATGYLELRMPQSAIDCLDRLGELGPFEAEAALVRGEALRMQEKYADAEASFETAVLKLPAPFDKPAWLALSSCYCQAGDLDRAIDSLARARGAHGRPHHPKSP